MCVWFLFCVTFNIKHFHDVGYGFYARNLGFILVSQSPQYMSLLCVHGHTCVLYDLHIWEYISRIHIVYYTYCAHVCICVCIGVCSCTHICIIVWPCMVLGLSRCSFNGHPRPPSFWIIQLYIYIYHLNIFLL